MYSANCRNFHVMSRLLATAVLLTSLLYLVTSQVVPGSNRVPGVPRRPQLDQPAVKKTSRLRGPNVCGPRASRHCCPGWTTATGSNRCSIPICSGDCGSGRCKRPNQCLCPDNRLAPACVADRRSSQTTHRHTLGDQDYEVDVPALVSASELQSDDSQRTPQSSAGSKCRTQCQNGGSCRGLLCICLPGYQGPHCGQPVCSGGCGSGRCVSPSTCSCPQGYSGNQCETDLRTGPCFTELRDNKCRGQLTGVVCTRLLCCATIGRAWGSPCEQCPEHPKPCRRGYLFNAAENQCVDVNECHTIPGLCFRGRCVNSLGSYSCVCEAGTKRNPSTNVCEDIDECAETGSAVCQNGQCHNTEGSYRCTCSDGFQVSPDGSQCLGQAVGECYAETDCRGSFPQRATQRDCCCRNNRSWRERQGCQICPAKTTAEYRNLCQGFTDTGPNTILENGQDICRMSADLCPHGRCVTVPGSYRCDCFTGFKPDQQGQCTDINECDQVGICSHGKCSNSDGSFRCICNAGYHLSADGTQCLDVDECHATGTCQNGSCVNGMGSYRCQCSSGYKQAPTQQSCIDINECVENRGICLNGQCINRQGSYTCVCSIGYQLSPDNAFCIDHNECNEIGMCTHGQCVNSEGSFKCLCDTGFVLAPNGKECADVNECVSLTDACVGGQCINTIGSYRCQCPSGFSFTNGGKTCQDARKGLCYTDIREGQCYNPSSQPVLRSSCCCMSCAEPVRVGWGQPCEVCPSIDTEEFRALCPNGCGVGPDGSDINECSVNPNICGSGACENLVPGFRCVCNSGFEIDRSGKSCQDINECAKDRTLCARGQCRNTPGSFHCSCPTGYYFDIETRACEDRNECEEGRPCINAICVNLPGSFRCECFVQGTSLDSTRTMCIDNRRGMCWARFETGRCEGEVHSNITKYECCSAAVGKAWGSPCEHCFGELVAPLSLTTSYPIRALGDNNGNGKNGNNGGPQIGAAGPYGPNVVMPNPDGSCQKGYMSHNGYCVDVNECHMFPDMCKNGGVCINNEGSFICQCPPHLTLDQTGLRCFDNREALCYSRYQRGRCDLPYEGNVSKAACCCSIGSAWGDVCQLCPSEGTDDYRQLCVRGRGFGNNGADLNECLLFPAICTHGRCRNTVGSFICTCDTGYELDEDGTNCTDVDECRVSSVSCINGTCQNLPGRYNCICNKGFEDPFNVQTCTDIDECSRDPLLCRGGHCINTVGSYVCQCPEGHELTPDSKACKDIDECSTTSGICSNGHCENFMGGYECICEPGFKPTPQKTSCQDIDECRSNNGGCSTICTNLIGSFECSCHRGYHLKPDQRTCEDISECEVTPDACGRGSCVNTPGTYRCNCTDGLELSPDQKHCVDVDECRFNTSLCRPGVCHNNMGSFSCECQPGYTIAPAGTHCEDIDECETDTHKCDSHSVCYNTIGSYKCSCSDGFSGTGFKCTDNNECLTNNGGCDTNAACVNTPGSFRCVCDEGFEGNGYECIDVDECSIDPNTCSHGQCMNYPGGYRCECDMGFTALDKERTCADINECDMFRNLCINGKCDNMMGHFQCSCGIGYKLDVTGGNCTDINECDNTDNCVYGTCINRPGGFECRCPPGHELTPAGTGCVDRRRGLCYLHHQDRSGTCTGDFARDVTKATCCCTVGHGWAQQKQNCEMCPRNGTREYEELCPGGQGFRPNAVTVILEDVDECSETYGVCRGGECKNVFGSYICTCRTGYRLDENKQQCADIDECVETRGLCGIGKCKNTEGSYTCICPSGHQLLPDNTCMDVRPGHCFQHVEQVARRIVCEQSLASNLTRRQCCCTIGKGWIAVEDERPPQSCDSCPRQNTNEYNTLCSGRRDQSNPDRLTEDINECEIIPNICQNGQCVNTIGSFQCSCLPGYRYEPVIHICEDINECVASRPCVGNAQCINVPGSFECLCPEGYRIGLNQRTCIDIDECAERTGVCLNGHCINLLGSFNCHCESGYRLSSTRDTCIDIDECREQAGICGNGTCQNTLGSHRCKCSQGFTLTAKGSCEDVNECNTVQGICVNGRCRNSLGSFVCVCQTGYRYNSERMICEDLDECAESRDICEHGTCINKPGSFVCQCEDGFELVPTGDSCQDINECSQPGFCRNGECINSRGSFTCRCESGYELQSNGRECKDMRTAQCYGKFQYGRCTEPTSSNVTKASCCCAKGAAWGADPCEVCPRPGEESFKVICPKGYGYGELSEDINECLSMPDACTLGRCVNTDGSYRCECPPGYTVTAAGTDCRDTDECLVDNFCGRGRCTNIDGGFECSCDHGFAPGPDGKCEDINECLQHPDTCAFRCQNTPGSFHCLCPKGFRLSPDGRHCEDIDECRSPVNNCRHACKNLVGSFMCVCPEGFEQIGPGDVCRDIDECRTVNGVCANGQCINTQGAFQCQCTTGYRPSQDKKQCLDIREGYCYYSLANDGRCLQHSDRVPAMTKSQCCCTSGAAWGPKCEKCPNVGTANHKVVCPMGPGYGPDGMDLDECRLMPGACQNGRCINTLGSYRCLCNPGYQVDSGRESQCIDVDECQVITPSPCEFECRNTPGSFTCTCPSGFRLDGDGRTCLDVDECELNSTKTGRSICPHSCVNTRGSFECNCNSGFRKNGKQCADIDECAESSGICQPNGNCQNLPGSYQCGCPRGYGQDKSRKSCVDKDECSDDQMCQYGCTNMPGGYRCECPIGFIQHLYWNQCIDENECQRPGVCGHAACLNTVGGYQCQCAQNALFDASSMACVGLGGGGCSGAPCTFGCTATQAGFSCNCPGGFQRIGQGHCVSTSSPPGTVIGTELGLDIPHVAGSPDQVSLPPGEVCYQCGESRGVDTKSAGVPLRNRAERRKRDTLRLISNLTQLSSASQLIIDVSGRNAIPLDDDDDLDDNVTLIHVKDLHRLAMPMTSQQTNNDVTERHGNIVVYIHRSATAAGYRIIDFLPSLKSLQKNEKCTLLATDSDVIDKSSLFHIDQQNGTNTLKFTSAIKQSAVYNVLVTCRALIGNDIFTMPLEVHIV